MKISEWSCAEVKQWLVTEGFEKLSMDFCDKHEIDGEVLLTLTERDLKEPPLQLQKLSDIKKLGKSLRNMQKKHAFEQRPTSDNNENELFDNTPRYATHDVTKLSNNMSFEEFSTDSNTSHVSFDGNANGLKRKEFEPEYKKLAVSFLYAVIVSWITAYTMVVVHERVPDKQKHPPLPDIFLDNIPLIPYAFKLAECCGIILVVMFFTIIFFHKYRVIVMRRFFSIASTIFLLRCVTMFVTSLSVPGSHLNCKAQFMSPWQRITRATEIVTCFGMSLTGLQTCGDYMFSGHTAYLTLFNHLITEYSPRWLYGVHTISWVLNLFGVFFILAAHEHYSIDVLIAFYITSRIFLYYHVLANTRSFWQNKMIKFWFPMMSYFECNVPGKVPNEYEWPWQHLSFGSMKNDLFKKLKTA